MKATKLFLAFLLVTGLFTACKKDNEPEPETSQPTIENIELGLGNNEIGIIGEDFHFNAEILAGDKIETVQIKIIQRNDETYSKVWTHEITWDQYKGVKNANVHTHFDLPDDAPEGKYDFLIIVHDQNGTKLEVKMNFTIYASENLPVNPILSLLTIHKNSSFFYRQGNYTDQKDTYSKGNIFMAQATVSGVKGDGKFYLLLINKNANHHPETIEQIDFNKVIVYDVFEHKNMAEVGHFSNSVFENFQVVRSIPSLTVGAEIDNNSPIANPILGARVWQSGDYTFLILYKNTTYNINFLHSVQIPIEYN